MSFRKFSYFTMNNNLLVGTFDTVALAHLTATPPRHHLQDLDTRSLFVVNLFQFHKTSSLLMANKNNEVNNVVM